MARRTRNDGPDTWHHVMNRAIAKRSLFETSEDNRFFLSGVARAVRRGHLEEDYGSVAADTTRTILTDEFEFIGAGWKRYFFSWNRTGAIAPWRSREKQRTRVRNVVGDSRPCVAGIVRYVQVAPVGHSQNGSEHRDATGVDDADGP